jgi:hypothetical protein
MKNSASIFIVFYLLFTVSAFGQISSGGSPSTNPCGGGPSPEEKNIAFNALVQTPGSIGFKPDNDIVDNDLIDINQFSGSPGINNWVELDLVDIEEIYAIQIYHPGNNFANLSNWQDVYMLFSKSPFQSKNLNISLADPDVSYINISSQMSSGQQIPFVTEARYVRIQAQSPGTDLIIQEIIILGGDEEEICGNGIDDDCDGFTDCEDSDCEVSIINVDITTEAPSCPICTDGKLFIEAYGQNLMYSIDGGTTFQSSPIFDFLPEGDYDIVVISNSTNCSDDTTISFLAPEGVPSDCCTNGGFEFGDFSNWTGGLTTNPNRDNEGAFIIPTFSNTTLFTTDNPTTSDIDEARHRIVNTDYVDPILPGLPINSRTGTYIARLGNSSTGRNVDKLSYTLTVDECNSDFRFNYMLVLEDPDHSSQEEPYFQFTITDVTLGEVVKNVKRVSEDTDPFFIGADIAAPGSGVLQPVAFTFWKCEATDLSARMGNTIRIDFIVSDCAVGGHFGYAYIDALCGSEDDLSPNPVIEGLYDNYCDGQDIVLDLSSSSGFNQFGWEICRITSTGQKIDCVSDNLSPTEEVGFFDVKKQYIDAGQNITCGNTYQVELTFSNDCFLIPVIVTQTFNILCDPPLMLDYADIINCSSSQTDILIEGTTNCNNSCTFSWEPANYLNDPTVEFPIIEGTLNTEAVRQVYSVTATNSVGCTAVDEVNIYNPVEGIVTGRIIEEHCSYQLEGTVTYFGYVPRYVMEGKFINIATGEIIPATLSTPTDITVSTVWTFESAQLDKTNFTPEDIWWFATDISTDDSCIDSEGIVGIIPDAPMFYGDTYIIIPDIFTPGESTSNRFMPFTWVDCANPFAEPDYCRRQHNMIEATLKVYNRWGVEVFNKTATSGSNTPFDVTELEWDGTYNGNYAPSDVYLWSFEFYNCSTPSYSVMCPEISPCDSFGLDYQMQRCDNCNLLSGQVTLTR